MVIFFGLTVLFVRSSVFCLMTLSLMDGPHSDLFVIFRLEREREEKRKLALKVQMQFTPEDLALATIPGTVGIRIPN